VYLKLKISEMSLSMS